VNGHRETRYGNLRKAIVGALAASDGYVTALLWEINPVFNSTCGNTTPAFNSITHKFRIAVQL
jgi:hypothetical protein